MSTIQHRHRDVSHHHPRIRRVSRGHWVWECTCGGSSRRSATEPLAWRGAVVEALLHAELIAP